MMLDFIILNNLIEWYLVVLLMLEDKSEIDFYLKEQK